MHNHEYEVIEKKYMVSYELRMGELGLCYDTPSLRIGSETRKYFAREEDLLEFLLTSRLFGICESNYGQVNQGVVLKDKDRGFVIRKITKEILDE